MENRITVREAVTEIEIAAFWEQLYNYYKRDIFPDSVDGEQNHFLGGEYRQHMEIIHKRPQDRCYYLLFYQNEQNVGFAMPVITQAKMENVLLWTFAFTLNSVEMVWEKNVPEHF